MKQEYIILNSEGEALTYTHVGSDETFLPLYNKKEAEVHLVTYLSRQGCKIKKIKISDKL